MADKSFWMDAGFWVNVVLALFTAFAAVAAIWQGWLVKKTRDDARRDADTQEKHNQQLVEAAKRSADAAEQSAGASKLLSETGLRAWLFVGQMHYPQQTEKKFPVLVSAEIKNAGNTPAKNVQMAATWNVFRSAPEALYPSGLPEENNCGTIGPGALVQYPLDLSNAVVHETQIRSGELQLYVYGVIKYNDVFGGQHKTEWCLWFENPGHFSFAPKFNESD